MFHNIKNLKFLKMGFTTFVLQVNIQKDLSQFQRKSAHEPQKELPKRKL